MESLPGRNRCVYRKKYKGQAIKKPLTGLTLGGSGSLTLTADNSTTLTAPVTLADTASLKVTGSIGGNVIVGGTNVLTGTIGKDVNIGGTLKVEIGGANPGRLDVGGTLDITNATVDLDGEPAPSTPIIIASYGTLAGTEFATVTDLPAGYTLDYNYNSLKQIALVSDGSPFDTWAATGSMGTVTFKGDTNADGVEDGMAFLLGASSPDVDANGLLPTLSENDGALVLSFSMLNAANRGLATFSTQHSSDLGLTDAWDAVGNQALVPDGPGVGIVVGVVSFNVSVNVEDSELNDVVATIPPNEANGGGKLFGRLSGSAN